MQPSALSEPAAQNLRRPPVAQPFRPAPRPPGSPKGLRDILHAYGILFFNPGAPDTGPKYAIKRPAVIAPVQKTSDSTAKTFAPPVTGLRSSDGLPNTRRRISTMLTTATVTNPILMETHGSVIVVVV